MTETDSMEPDLARRRTLRARTARDAHALEARKQRALAVAHRAAAELVDTFGATRVVLFGSLAHGRWFGTSSDIDLAAWGLGPEAHLLALARLEDLAGDLPFTLVRAERCSAAMLEGIEAEGVAL